MFNVFLECNGALASVSWSGRSMTELKSLYQSGESRSLCSPDTPRGRKHIDDLFKDTRVLFCLVEEVVCCSVTCFMP
jgi:hypothetical protein